MTPLNIIQDKLSRSLKQRKNITRNKTRYLEEADDCNLVVLNKLLGSLGVLQGDGRRSGLLLNPGNDGVGSSASGVLDSLALAAKQSIDQSMEQQTAKGQQFLTKQIFYFLQ